MKTDKPYLENKSDDLNLKEINKILDGYVEKKNKTKQEYYKAPGDELEKEIQELMPVDCYVEEFLGKLSISTIKTEYLLRNDYLGYDQQTRNLVLEVLKVKAKLFDVINDVTHKTIFLKWIEKLEAIQYQ